MNTTDWTHDQALRHINLQRGNAAEKASDSQMAIDCLQGALEPDTSHAPPGAGKSTLVREPLRLPMELMGTEETTE